MNIDCNIIQDLIPLYVEKIASDESNQLIEEHISECDICKEKLALLQQEDVIPEMSSEEIMPLKILKSNINKRKRRAVEMISLIVFLITFTIFSYLTKPRYVTYKESGITVEENTENEIYAVFHGDVTAYRMHRSVLENGKHIVEIEAWTSIWDKLLDKSTPSILIASDKTPVDTVYYCENTTGDNMKIVYGENPYGSGGVITLPRLVMGYYVILAILGTIIIGVIWLFASRNRVLRRVLQYIFFLPISYLMSVILLQNGGPTYSAPRDFSMNLIAGIAIYGICNLGLASYRQWRADRMDEKQCNTANNPISTV